MRRSEHYQKYSTNYKQSKERSGGNCGTTWVRRKSASNRGKGHNMNTRESERRMKRNQMMKQAHTSTSRRSNKP